LGIFQGQDIINHPPGVSLPNTQIVAGPHQPAIFQTGQFFFLRDGDEIEREPGDSSGRHIEYHEDRSRSIRSGITLNRCC
jgi:hypothetical protein